MIKPFDLQAISHYSILLISSTMLVYCNTALVTSVNSVHEFITVPSKLYTSYMHSNKNWRWMTTFQKVLASTKSKGMCIYVGLLLLLSNYIIFVLICYFVRSGNVFVHVLYSMYSTVLVCFSMYSYLNKRVWFNGLRDIQLKETRKPLEGKNAPQMPIVYKRQNL